MNGVETQFGAWIGQAADLYKRHFAILIPAGLLGGALSLLSAGILAGPMAAGMVLILFRLLDGEGPKPEISDLFKGFDFFVQSLLYLLVWGLLLLVVSAVLSPTALGRVLAFAIGLSAQTVLAFGFFLLVDRRLDFRAAALESYRVVRPAFFPLLAWVLLAGLLGGIGFLLCGVGLVATLPFSWVMLAVAYRAVFRVPPAPRPEMASVHPEPGNG